MEESNQWTQGRSPDDGEIGCVEKQTLRVKHARVYVTVVKLNNGSDVHTNTHTLYVTVLLLKQMLPNMSPTMATALGS